MPLCHATKQHLTVKRRKMKCGTLICSRFSCLVLLFWRPKFLFPSCFGVQNFFLSFVLVFRTLFFVCLFFWRSKLFCCFGVENSFFCCFGVWNSFFLLFWCSDLVYRSSLFSDGPCLEVSLCGCQDFKDPITNY